MTQGRIGGPMLRDNLVRNGVDLAFETDLLYFDVNNMRIGINKAVPTADLDVDGTTRLANIQLASNTISTINSNGNLTLSPNGTGNVILNTSTANRVIYAGTNKELLTSANLTFDGSELVISTASSTTMKAGNIQISTNTITSIDTNGNIVLNPSGTGNVILDHLTAGRITYTGASKEIITNANLTFDGTTFVLTGVANIDNVQIDGNTISSRNSNGNIALTPNGTGKVLVSYLTPGRLAYASTGGSLVDSASLTFDGTNLYVTGINVLGGGGGIYLGNIEISGNTISSTNTNGNIELDPNGTGKVKVLGTNALTLPSGTLSERPAGLIGDIRVNSDSGYLEFFDGTNWQTITGDSTVIVSDSFNGDGSTVNFTLSQSGTSSSTFISVNGVVQKPSTAYSVSGTTLTFVEAPAVGDVIDVRLLKSIVDVTFINDGDTSIMVYDSTQKAEVAINGNLVLSITNAALLPGSNLTYDIGSTSLRWKTIFANTFVSSVTTGTAPFTVNSTTQVANLNAETAGTAGTVTTAAQSNITSLGNLTIANIDNIQIDGNTISSTNTNGNIDISPNGTGNINLNDPVVVTSTLSATRFISNIATGTAPITVTSTTQVANLNVATAGSLVNGTSNVTIVNNANVNISSAGNANVLIVTGSGANVAGTITSTGIISDGVGNLRSIPQNSQTAVYVLAATDNGKHISTNANVTVPNTIFSAGQTISVYNNSAANINILQDTGVTMYLAGTATTGNRTLQQRGIATVLCVAANTFVVTGAGIT